MAEPPPAATSTAAPETTPTARPPSKRDRGSRSSAMARIGFVERLASLARWRATDVRSGDVRPRRRSPLPVGPNAVGRRHLPLWRFGVDRGPLRSAGRGRHHPRPGVGRRLTRFAVSHHRWFAGPSRRATGIQSQRFAWRPPRTCPRRANRGHGRIADGDCRRRTVREPRRQRRRVVLLRHPVGLPLPAVRPPPVAPRRRHAARSGLPDVRVQHARP